MEYYCLNRYEGNKAILSSCHNDNHSLWIVDYDDFSVEDLYKYKFFFNLDFTNSEGFQDYAKVIYYDNQQVELFVYRKKYNNGEN